VRATSAIPGARFGAWLSDVLINAVGQVAILIPAFIFHSGGGHVAQGASLDGDCPGACWGLFLALLSLGALAGLQLQSNLRPNCPMRPGVFLGLEVARSLSVVLGVFGGTLLLIAVALISITVATGLVVVLGDGRDWAMPCGTWAASLAAYSAGSFNAQREAWRERRAMKKSTGRSGALI
jgi:hypothetical protein